MHQEWDDEPDYHRAVGRTWAMVVIALVCSLLVVGFVAAAILGTDFFLDLVEALSK